MNYKVTKRLDGQHRLQVTGKQGKATVTYLDHVYPDKESLQEALEGFSGQVHEARRQVKNARQGLRLGTLVPTSTPGQGGS